eukprot:scaffold273299_cov18-Tisochrysis_lutea.AAC.1
MHSKCGTITAATAVANVRLRCGMHSNHDSVTSAAAAAVKACKGACPGGGGAAAVGVRRGACPG